MAQHPPLVSLVMATHARPQFLGAALRSIQAQTMPDWELLLMDTGPRAQAVTSEAVGGEPRLRYVACHDMSQAAALNRGSRQARGTWLAFHDDDDVSHPRRLELCLERARQSGRSLVQPAHALLQAGERLDFLVPNQLSKLLLVKRTLFAQLGRFRPFFRVHEDLDFFLRLQESGWRAAALPQILYFYRNHLAPRVSEQAPLYGGAYALAAHWSAYCRRQKQPDPIEAGASLDEMMQQFSAMPQPNRDRLLEIYLVNSAKFGFKRAIWRGQNAGLRAALGELRDLLKICGYGCDKHGRRVRATQSISQLMLRLRASLWMLQAKEQLGWRRQRGGVRLQVFLQAAERNPDLLQPQPALAFARMAGSKQETRQ